MSVNLVIDPEIRRARLPPGEMYGDPQWHAALQERVFHRSWQLLYAIDDAEAQTTAIPVDHPAAPLVFTRGDHGEALLSNVCTHRGATVIDAPCRARTLRCPYHGRRWKPDGRLAAAPGFEGALEFPTQRDDLAAVDVAGLGPWRFGAVQPAVPFDDWAGPVGPWLAGLWETSLQLHAEESRAYEMDANWALYVDNYLEGFHVNYVHPGLAEVLDPRDYRQELFPWGTMQLGMATSPEDAIVLPEGHPLFGEQIAGLYLWLFPNLMINVYPWGVSLNVVEPLGPMRTRVVYRTWVADPSRRGGGAGGDLHQVEMEDQMVVARAQDGVRSPLYPGGRYSPAHEVGLHHFHRLLAKRLGSNT